MDESMVIQCMLMRNDVYVIEETKKIIISIVLFILGGIL